MPFSNITGRYYQKASSEYPKSISYQQLLAFNYKLRRSGLGWWADGYVCPDGVMRRHSPATIKSLLKNGLLEGNSRLALVGWDGISTTQSPIPMLWTSAKGKKLLNKISEETGLAFDKTNYELIEPGTDEVADGIVLGQFASEREAALAYDQKQTSRLRRANMSFFLMR